MGEPSCWGIKDVCAIRVAQLTSSGAPSPGSSNGYVSDALVKLERKTNVDAGSSEVMRNGCGVVCQSAITDDAVLGHDLTATLCSFDPQLASLLIDGTLFIDTGTSDAMGVKEAAPEDEILPVCFEWWTKAWDNSQQAEPLILGGSPGYWHHVIPFNKFRLGDSTYEYAMSEVVFEGKGRPNPNITANGPFNDWDADVAARNGVDSGYGVWLDATLPTAACDLIAVPSGS